MKTTFDLPAELVHEVKLRASEKPADTRVRLDEQGLPTFVCGCNAPASRMSAEELLALEQDTLSVEGGQRDG